MLIDSHCHLDEFSDIKEIIKKAKENRVEKILSNSVDLKSAKKHLKLKQIEQVEIALGLHPSNSVFGMKKEEIEKTLNFVEEKIDKASAVGEIGLDYKHGNTNDKRKTQKKVLKRQLLTALEYDKPVVIHSRRSHHDCFKALKEYSPKKVLMHWFYDEKFLNKIVNRNYFVSVGPSVFTDKHVQNFAKKIPLKNLLLETDAPVKFNGEKAEPSWIKKVAEKVSELRGIELKELEKNCEKNFEQFLK